MSIPSEKLNCNVYCVKFNFACDISIVKLTDKKSRFDFWAD